MAEAGIVYNASVGFVISEGNLRFHSGPFTCAATRLEDGGETLELE